MTNYDHFCPLVRNERNVRDVRNALHYINDKMKEETD